MAKWEMVKLGNAATFINGYAFKPSDWSNEGLPIIRIQNLTGSSNLVNYYNKPYDKRYEVNNGDILISWSASLGVYEWNGGKGLLNQHIFKVVFNKLDFDRRFFMYIVSQKIDAMIAVTHGSTMKHITKKYFDAIQVPLPPLPVQQKIADVLDCAAALIQKRKTQIDKLDLLVKSQFIEMFGDPTTNPMGWEMPCIENLAVSSKNALKAGPFGSSLKKEDYTEKGYKIYGQEQVIKGDAFYGDYYISEQKYNALKSCAVSEGDVLISLVGTYGKVLIVPYGFEPGIINPRLVKISFDKNKINTVFFEHFFASDSLKTKLDSNTNGCTMGVLNLGIIKKINIPLPPIVLQNQFARFVEQADKSKFTMRQELNAMETLYKALMQKCFSGQIFS